MAIALQGSFDELDTPLCGVTFVVVDVETTGGTPASSSLTEVAAARYRGGELLASYRTFVRPDERIPPFITALTGITDAMVADAPRVGEMLPSFLEFVGGAVLVGHNLRFDLSFLDHALVATGREPLTNATVDTLALARRLVRDLVPDCKLGTLARCLRLEHLPSHRALSDVLATGDLLHAMLERAGSFGIVGLEELLVLPRLVGHPQAAKLRLTTRVPHRPGVYWFTDAAGHVLYVGKATDLQSRVRSYFSGDGRKKVGRLLRQLDAVHHQVCPGTLTASVVEGRLIRAWSPPFNRQGRVRGGEARGRRPRQAEDAGSDPVQLLAPLAAKVDELSGCQRFEEAAAVRDEAERLRRHLIRNRRVEALRNAGRLVLAVEGEGMVELDRGVLTAVDALVPVGGTVPRSPRAIHDRDAEHGRRYGRHRATDGEQGYDGDAEYERIIVAHWLAAHAEGVRVIEAGPEGIAMPADRVPRLTELCRRQVGTTTTTSPAAAHSGPDRRPSPASGGALGRRRGTVP